MAVRRGIGELEEQVMTCLWATGNSATPAETTPIRLALAPHSVLSDDVFCSHSSTKWGLSERAAAQYPDDDDVLLGNERGEIT
ncbi:MAG: hypothetical protein ACI8Y4_004055 [Candidatus Poriferisodalaceae bacterium]|jgi:hypothetical protein